MTRSEAKAILIAWKEAARRINAACRQKGMLVQKLSTVSELSGSSAVSITIKSTDESGSVTTEAANAFLPHGSGTSDPTARVAERRMALEATINELTEEVDILEDFYMGVLKAISRLPESHAKILHLHYCTSNPGYTTPAGKSIYFYRLRCAVEAFQALDEIAIPDILKESDTNALSTVRHSVEGIERV